jgi:hypothetical protein
MASHQLPEECELEPPDLLDPLLPLPLPMPPLRTVVPPTFPVLGRPALDLAAESPGLMNELRLLEGTT